MQQSNDKFLDLPSDMLILIFQLLDTNSLIALSRTCKAIRHELSTEPRYWEFSRVSIFFRNEFEFLDLLKLSTLAVRHFSFSQIQHINSVSAASSQVFQYSSSFQHLETISMDNCSFDKPMMKFVCGWLEQQPAKKLCLLRSSMTAIESDKFTHSISCMEHLTTLVVSDCTLPLIFWERLAKSFTKMKQLSHLNMSGNLMTDCGLNNLNMELHNLTNLEALYLGSNSLKTYNLNLEANSKLCVLDLSANSFAGSQMEDLGLSIVDKQHLISLNLAYNQIGDQGFEMLATFLVHLKALRELALSGNSLTPKAYKTLVRTCRKKINHLHIRGNLFTPTQEQCLKKAFSKHSTPL